MNNIEQFRAGLHEIVDGKGFAAAPEVLKKIETSGFKYNKSSLQELRNQAGQQLNQLTTLHYVTGLKCFIDNFGLNADNTTSSQPTYLTPPPPSPELCIGRDKMLEKLHENLINGKNLLLVNGLGGMGKTTLALQYLSLPQYNSFYQHIAWVSLINQPFVDTFINSMQIGLELDGLQNYPDKEQQLQIIVQKLANLPGPNLLIIDNANDADELTANEKLLKQIHCKTIITTRCQPDNYQTMDVDELEMEDAKQVFKHHYTSNGAVLNQKDLESLLAYIGRHTLMTELLAKAGKKKGLEPARLLKILKETDTSHPDLNRNITLGLHADMTAKVKENKLHDYIQSLYEPENETEETKSFLQKFCLFANIDVPLTHLKRMWEIETKNENSFEDFLDKLVKTGLLSYKHNNYRMHQLLASVVDEKLKPNAQNCKALIKTISYILHKGHLSNVTVYYLPYAQAIVNRLKENDFSLGLLNIRLSDTYLALGQIISGLEAIEKAESIFTGILMKSKI